jgi:hypothetical protein
MILRALIEGAHVVVGVFPDTSTPTRIAMHIIKGGGLLEEIATVGQNRDARWEAVACGSRDDALAMQLAYGDGLNDDPH